MTQQFLVWLNLIVLLVYHGWSHSVKFDNWLNAGQDNGSLSPVAHTLQYKWYVADYESLELYLSTIDWCEVIYNNPSAEDAWMAFESILHTAIDCYVPHYVRSHSRKRHFKFVPINIVRCKTNKKAVLSQRWPLAAPYKWMPWKISGVPGYAHGYFSRNC